MASTETRHQGGKYGGGDIQEHLARMATQLAEIENQHREYVTRIPDRESLARATVRYFENHKNGHSGAEVSHGLLRTSESFSEGLTPQARPSTLQEDEPSSSAGGSATPSSGPLMPKGLLRRSNSSGATTSSCMQLGMVWEDAAREAGAIRPTAQSPSQQWPLSLAQTRGSSSKSHIHSHASPMQHGAETSSGVQSGDGGDGNHTPGSSTASARSPNRSRRSTADSPYLQQLQPADRWPRPAANLHCGASIGGATTQLPQTAGEIRKAQALARAESPAMRSPLCHARGPPPPAHSPPQGPHHLYSPSHGVRARTASPPHLVHSRSLPRTASMHQSSSLSVRACSPSSVPSRTRSPSSRTSGEAAEAMDQRSWSPSSQSLSSAPIMTTSCRIPRTSLPGLQSKQLVASNGGSDPDEAAAKRQAILRAYAKRRSSHDHIACKRACASSSSSELQAAFQGMGSTSNQGIIAAEMCGGASGSSGSSTQSGREAAEQARAGAWEASLGQHRLLPLHELGQPHAHDAQHSKEWPIGCEQVTAKLTVSQKQQQQATRPAEDLAASKQLARAHQEWPQIDSNIAGVQEEESIAAASPSTCAASEAHDDISASPEGEPGSPENPLEFALRDSIPEEAFVSHAAHAYSRTAQQAMVTAVAAAAAATKAPSHLQHGLEQHERTARHALMAVHISHALSNAAAPAAQAASWAFDDRSDPLGDTVLTADLAPSSSDDSFDDGALSPEQLQALAATHGAAAARASVTLARSAALHCQQLQQQHTAGPPSTGAALAVGQLQVSQASGAAPHAALGTHHSHLQAELQHARGVPREGPVLYSVAGSSGHESERHACNLTVCPRNAPVPSPPYLHVPRQRSSQPAQQRPPQHLYSPLHYHNATDSTTSNDHSSSTASTPRTDLVADDSVLFGSPIRNGPPSQPAVVHSGAASCVSSPAAPPNTACHAAAGPAAMPPTSPLHGVSLCGGQGAALPAYTPDKYCDVPPSSRAAGHLPVHRATSAADDSPTADELLVGGSVVAMARVLAAAQQPWQHCSHVAEAAGASRAPGHAASPNSQLPPPHWPAHHAAQQQSIQQPPQKQHAAIPPNPSQQQAEGWSEMVRRSEAFAGSGTRDAPHISLTTSSATALPRTTDGSGRRCSSGETSLAPFPPGALHPVPLAPCPAHSQPLPSQRQLCSFREGSPLAAEACAASPPRGVAAASSAAQPAASSSWKEVGINLAVPSNARGLEVGLELVDKPLGTGSGPPDTPHAPQQHHSATLDGSCPQQSSQAAELPPRRFSDPVSGSVSNPVTGMSPHHVMQQAPLRCATSDGHPDAPSRVPCHVPRPIPSTELSTGAGGARALHGEGSSSHVSDGTCARPQPSAAPCQQLLSSVASDSTVRDKLASLKMRRAQQWQKDHASEGGTPRMLALTAAVAAAAVAQGTWVQPVGGAGPLGPLGPLRLAPNASPAGGSAMRGTHARPLLLQPVVVDLIASGEMQLGHGHSGLDHQHWAWERSESAAGGDAAGDVNSGGVASCNGISVVSAGGAASKLEALLKLKAQSVQRHHQALQQAPGTEQHSEGNAYRQLSDLQGPHTGPASRVQVPGPGDEVAPPAHQARRQSPAQAAYTSGAGTSLCDVSVDERKPRRKQVTRGELEGSKAPSAAAAGGNFLRRRSKAVQGAKVDWSHVKPRTRTRLEEHAPGEGSSGCGMAGAQQYSRGAGSYVGGGRGNAWAPGPVSPRLRHQSAGGNAGTQPAGGRSWKPGGRALPTSPGGKQAAQASPAVPLPGRPDYEVSRVTTTYYPSGDHQLYREARGTRVHSAGGKVHRAEEGGSTGRGQAQDPGSPLNDMIQQVNHLLKDMAHMSYRN